MKKSIYLFGACKDCAIVKRITQMPNSARYVCTTDGYDIYDASEFEEKYFAIAE
jgi:hypothetical protein